MKTLFANIVSLNAVFGLHLLVTVLLIGGHNNIINILIVQYIIIMAITCLISKYTNLTNYITI